MIRRKTQVRNCWDFSVLSTTRRTMHILVPRHRFHYTKTTKSSSIIRGKCFCHNTRQQSVQNFQGKLSVENWAGSERPETSSQQQQILAYYFDRNAKKSLRTIARDFSFQQSSIQRILRKRFNMFPYKIYIAQELEDCDYRACTSFASWRLQNIQSGSSFSNHLLFTDKCVLHVDGKVNNGNVKILGTEKAH